MARVEAETAIYIVWPKDSKPGEKVTDARIRMTHSIQGEDPTLTPTQARAIAKALICCAKDADEIMGIIPSNN